MANPTIQLVRNDTQPQVQLNLSDEGGPLDLANKTVKLHLRKNARSGVLLTREAFIPTGTADQGLAYIYWSEGDLDLDRGSYEAEIEVVGQGSYRQTVYEILEVEIREDFA